jgi:hypothetical protein
MQDEAHIIYKEASLALDVLNKVRRPWPQSQSRTRVMLQERWRAALRRHKRYGSQET